MTEIPDVVKKPNPLLIALVAPPNGGKTYFLEHWPNILVLDCEGKLSPTTLRVPLNDAAFINKWAKPYCDNPANWRAARPTEASHLALFEWLKKVGPTLTKPTALALDCFTHLLHSIDAWIDMNRAYFVEPKSGKVNDYAGWKYQLVYWHKLFTEFKKLSVNTIITFHEEPDKDNTGKLNGRIKALCGGSFKDQIESYWNLSLRILNKSTPNNPNYRFQLATDLAWTPRLQGCHLDTDKLKEKLDKKDGTIPASYADLREIMIGGII